MPTYELALLLKALPKPELAAVLKRTATAIFDEGGIVRKMENLGVKPTPFKISAHGAVHKQAHYFVISFDSAYEARMKLLQNYHLDVDVVRCRVFHRSNLRLRLEEQDPCSLHLDLLPAPYRPNVQEMLKQSEKRAKPKFKYNSGMDYYPFQR